MSKLYSFKITDRIFKMITFSVVIFGLFSCADNDNPYLYNQVKVPKLKAYQSNLHDGKNYVYRLDHSIFLTHQKEIIST